MLDLGELLGTEGQYEKAVVLLEQATTLRPPFADSFLKLGKVYLLQKKYEKARDALKKAVDLSPTNAEAHFLLSRAYFGLGETPAAQATHERFRTLQQAQQEKQGNAPPPRGKR
jgi:tetratricopeptide (TPR) repeat protein